MNENIGDQPYRLPDFTMEVDQENQRPNKEA